MILDQISYLLLLGYAFVSCWGMDRLPAGFVSIAGLVYIARYAVAPYRLHYYPELLKPFFLFIATAVLSTLALWPHLALDPAWSFVDRILTFPIAILVCRTRTRVLGLLLALSFSASVVAADALHQVWQQTDARVSGFFGHPVHLGEHLLLCIVFLLPLTFASFQPRRVRYAQGITVVLSLAALLFNATRAAWIASGSVFILYVAYMAYMMKIQAPIARRGMVLTLLLLALCASTFFASPALQQRLASVTDLQYQSNSERIIIWHSALSMIADHPLLGVGPDNFGKEYRESYMRPEAKERHQRDAHSTYLSITAELGFVGLFAFLYLLFSQLRFFYQRLRTSSEPEWSLGALFCLLAFCVYGFMNSMINTFWAVRLLCLCLGIAMAGGTLAKKR